MAVALAVAYVLAALVVVPLGYGLSSQTHTILVVALLLVGFVLPQHFADIVVGVVVVNAPLVATCLCPCFAASFDKTDRCFAVVASAAFVAAVVECLAS